MHFEEYLQRKTSEAVPVVWSFYLTKSSFLGGGGDEPESGWIDVPIRLPLQAAVAYHFP